MTDSTEQVISALREELQQYGEMLALLDRQQQLLVDRTPDEIGQSVRLIQAQGVAIQKARAHRESCRQRVAAAFSQPENAPFVDLIPALPVELRPLIKALVDENNELLVRVQQRARQNHLLLSRSVELMQGLLNTLLQSRETRVYNDQGGVETAVTASRPLYEGVG
jgi:flagellar biosynthesis/type III secretory pathway chaperone